MTRGQPHAHSSAHSRVEVLTKHCHVHEWGHLGFQGTSFSPTTSFLLFLDPAVSWDPLEHNLTLAGENQNGPANARFSVRVSFVLKNWNLFVPLTLPSCNKVQTQGDATQSATVQSSLSSWNVKTFHTWNVKTHFQVSLRVYPLAILGKSLSEL